jgi:predicted ATPase
VLEAYSVSHGKATAYLPVIELLKSYFDIQAQDDERKRREKVAGKVVMLDRSLEETLPYLFALLGIEEQPSPLQQMDPQIRRRRTFDALKKLFLRESLNQPLVLIFEDLHWIDGETQGFLDVLSESVASAKILLLTNYRPEYRHEWGQKTYYTQLRLAPFGKAEAEEFLDALLGIHSSPQPSLQRGEGESPRPTGERDRVRGRENNFDTLKQLILDKTQGTPFFMEEIVQELVEQGVLVRDGVETRCSASLPTNLQLPPTVQGILAARIDRLASDEKAFLQQLSVIGRQFPLSLIRQVITQSEADLFRLLASLQHKEFLYEQPAFPESEYIFKHALTQEVAYGTVLQGQRKALHEQTAKAIETLYSTNLDEHYSELAHHYSRSGNTQKAVEYLRRAGQQAVQRSANTEAITHLTTALELLKTLPDSPRRTRQELFLQTTLGPALMVTKGYAAPEVGKAYARARELCQQVGETPQLFSVLWGLGAFHFVRAELQTTHELWEQALRLAENLQDPALLVEAYSGLGAVLFHLGNLAPAQEYSERGMTFYSPQQHRSHAFHNSPHDPGVMSLAYSAWSLWYLGYADQALQRVSAALTLAQELSHPLSLAVALTFSVLLHHYRRERQAAQERAEALIAFCTDQGFPSWVTFGAIYRGWALAEQGKGEEGIAQIRQALAILPTTGTELDRPYFLTLLAEAYGKVGQVEEGLSVLAEALGMVDKTRERVYEAELYRLKGELTLQQWKVESQKSKVPNPQHPTPSTQAEAEVEACFRKAIEIAQKQQAKSLELRAVMSLVRSRQRQASEQEAGSKEQGARTTQHVTREKLDEARRMLSEVYHWFTEGFDTKDLQEAKTLLQELF